jgi:hypothetical protein
MRKHRTTLLAGIGALALIAGAGVASAQQNEEHGAKQPPAASHEMNKGGAMGHTTAAPNGAAGNRMDRSAADQNPGKMDQKAAEEKKAVGKMDRNAADEDHGKMDRNAADENKAGGKPGQNAEPNKMDHGTTAQDRERSDRHDEMAQPNERNGQAAERNDRNGQNTAEQRNEPRGNARANVQLNEQQRTRIRETVLNAGGAPRLAHVDFNVAIGTVIPRTGVRIVPVPETLVTIDPSWRGLSYFVYEDEIVLIDPATMTIVAVINV